MCWYKMRHIFLYDNVFFDKRINNKNYQTLYSTNKQSHKIYLFTPKTDPSPLFFCLLKFKVGDSDPPPWKNFLDPRQPSFRTSLKHNILVIRSVSDVLRAKSRFVKFVGGGGEAAGRTPYTFYKPTLGPKYVSNRPYNEFITPTTFI